MNSTRAEICRNVKPVMIKYLNCSHSPARRKRHIACDELFHFITKLIARSFCCSSLPNRTRFAGLRFGAAASRRFCLIAKNINFNRPSHVGAKSALLRRLFMHGAKTSARSLAPPFQLRPATAGTAVGRPPGDGRLHFGEYPNSSHSPK